MEKIPPLPRHSHGIDKIFFGLVVFFVIAGLLIFTSASFGLLSREGASFGDVAFGQLVFGLGLGLVGAFVMFKIPYTLIRRYAFYLFIASLLLTAAVFIPGLGVERGGATRWLSIGAQFQPAEILKLGTILFFASWLTSIGKDLQTWRFGIAPLGVILGVIGGILIAQPDNGTFLIIFASVVAMFIAAKGKWTHFFSILGVAIVFLLVVAMFKPYVMNRLTTFINPANDPLGASYQVRQALISIGSGGVVGRGFGQSIQKFNHLPEPVGDSIFAVFAEEFGFIGSLLLIGLYLAFAFRGLHIAQRAPDSFAKLATVGIITLIVSQSFLNIGAMLGVFPLTGVPLLFISHGGTALMLALVQMGLILQFSKYTK